MIGIATRPGGIAGAAFVRQNEDNTPHLHISSLRSACAHAAGRVGGADVGTERVSAAGAGDTGIGSERASADADRDAVGWGANCAGDMGVVFCDLCEEAFLAVGTAVLLRRK